ncbi:MAG: hypothetical protein Q7U82_00990 [Gammaproteobacteria bacterium]|nr:hypothetical protein [Gammaproteobacteria bacterium]
MKGIKAFSLLTFCVLFLCSSTLQSTELAIDSLVEFDLIGIYDVEAVETDQFAEEKYQITADASGHVYTVSVAGGQSRQGVSLYLGQALVSIPAIHGYQLLFKTGPFPYGFIFKKPQGYLIEYMKDLDGGIGVFIRIETVDDDYLTAVHEALDILSRFRPAE